MTNTLPQLIYIYIAGAVMGGAILMDALHGDDTSPIRTVITAVALVLMHLLLYYGGFFNPLFPQW